MNINCIDAEYMINSKNRWNDVYQNKYYYGLISNEFYMTHYFFTLLDNSRKSKIEFWNETITNMFFTQRTRDELWNKYINTQKQYHVLSKFVSKCKYIYTKVKVDTDLNLNEIILQPYKSVEIYQDKALYYFTVNDLINICNSALTFSYQFFSEAHIPKNPYTNNTFSYPILLKIYFSIRHSYFKMPLLFEMFYRSNFNIKHFKSKNDFFIREECIKNFMKNADNDELCEYIDEMLAERETNKLFKFHDDFPTDVLITAFKPYLFLFIISRYSLRSTRKILEYKSILTRSLRKFKRVNPSFGRTISKFQHKYSESRGKNIRTIVKSFVIEFKEGNISLPSFRELVSDILFKNDYNSDEESDDEESDDEEILNNTQFLARGYGMLMDLPIHREPRDPSIVDSDDDDDNTIFNDMDNNLNTDISSDDDDVDDNSIIINVNDHVDNTILNTQLFDVNSDDDDELNDTDSMS